MSMLMTWLVKVMEEERMVRTKTEVLGAPNTECRLLRSALRAPRSGGAPTLRPFAYASAFAKLPAGGTIVQVFTESDTWT